MDVLVTSDSKFGSSLLHHALSALGHRVQDTGTAGAGTLLANKMWQADVMVAAIVAGRSSRQRYGAVGVEIGVALERGLPILLVGKAGLSLPFLAGIPRVDYADDGDLLSAQLDLLLQAVADAPLHESFSRVSATPARVQSTGSSAAARARSFELEVGALLQATGAEVLDQVEVPQGGGQSDFTIFFPGSANNLGVVLVDAKTVLRKSGEKSEARRILADAAKKLSSRVLASRSGLGLLVYEGPVVGLSPAPMTVALSLSQLQDRLSSGSLDKVLQQVRNEAIHAL